MAGKNTMNLEEKVEIFRKYNFNHYRLLELDGFDPFSIEGRKAWVDDARKGTGKYMGFGNWVQALVADIGNLVYGEYQEKEFEKERKIVISKIWESYNSLRVLYDKINFTTLDPEDEDFNVFYETRDFLKGKDKNSILGSALTYLIDLCKKNNYEDVSNLPESIEKMEMLKKLGGYIKNYQVTKKRLVSKLKLKEEKEEK